MGLSMRTIIQNGLTTICASLVALSASAAGNHDLPASLRDLKPRMLKSFTTPNQAGRLDVVERAENITREEFGAIIDGIMEYYEPVAAARGIELEAIKLWGDPTVNAFAVQYDATKWAIHMFGGLARRPEVTPDGFALVVCHELGHHFGGYPFYDDAAWAASEGQSDYFATQACARYVWANDVERNAAAAAIAPPIVRERCDASWTETNDRNLCYRAALGGKSLGTLLAFLNGEPEPQFETPDTRVVPVMNPAHPAGQCRLDTYFQGALCNAGFNKDVIPGLGDANGNNSVTAERTAADSSCVNPGAFQSGFRPGCWFASNLKAIVEVDAAVWTEITGNGNGNADPGETFDIAYPLRNYGFTPSAGGHLVLTSASPIVAVGADYSRFDVVAPDATAMQLTPFRVTFNADAACGSRYSLAPTFIANGAAKVLTQNLRLGSMLSRGIGRNDVVTPIPDGASAVSTIMIDNAEMGTIARVEFDVTHVFPYDLIISLQSPSGEMYTVYDGSLGMVLPTGAIDIDIPPTAAGEWTLNVLDTYPGDSGTLNSWSLTVGSFTCQ